MKTQFKFLDPGAIMGVVVALIVLAVGVFAFFITMQNIPRNAAGGGGYIAYGSQADLAINNTTTTGAQVFNIVGIVLIIGAIMSIIALVYNYVR